MLERRKLMAEFAGYSWGNDEAALRSGLPDVPHYESDPSAACSLLPKIVDSQGLTRKEAHEMIDQLMDSLVRGDGPTACAAIYEAVKKIMEER